jgi:ribosomal protein S18 acetylase RimI-like enzyme
MLIRPAGAFDARAMARVYVHTWQQIYRGLLPDRHLDAMTVGRAERSILRRLDYGSGICSVAETDTGQVAGFVSGGPTRTADDIYRGEIYELYLLKEHRRQGIGRRLVQVLAERFNRMDIHTMMVWVLARNPHRRFYEKINGIHLRSSTILFAGVRLEAVAYGWISTDLVTRPA